ncbi:MAG: RNA polymerase factor sigma-54 [Planctomycetota bacterium]
MEIGLIQAQVQKQILSPQMIQSMEILVLNSLQLEERIDEALEENIALEVDEPDSAEDGAEERSRDDSATPATEGGEEYEGADAEVREMDLLEDRYEHLAEFQSEQFFNAPGGGRVGGGGDDEDDKTEALQNAADRPATLHDHLMQQVQLVPDLTPRQRLYCAEIVYSLDPRGRLLYPLEEMHQALLEAAANYAAANGNGTARAPIEPVAPPDAVAETPSPQQEAVAPPEPDAGVALGAGSVIGTTRGSEDAHSSQVDVSTAAESATGDDPQAGASAAVPEAAADPGANGAGRSDETGAEFPLHVALEPAPELSELEEALAIVRGLDPAGVGATSIEECLLLQLDRDPLDYPLERELIEKHLANIAKNRLPQIAKATGQPLDEVKGAIEIIAMLNPNPGRGFVAEETHIVRPDVFIDEDEGEYKVRVENPHVPRLRISPYYRTLFKEARNDPELRKYIKKKIDNAEWLLHAIHQRKSTLQRVAEEIVKHQQEYFHKGIRHLKPLKMQEIADIIGVNVSTVSRAISGKYFQYPGGVKELKFLFTGGTTKDDGSVESRGSVIERIKKLIADENKRKPLSDSQIVKLLAEQGIHISRRTVTKYREAESILSSRERREY